MKAIILILLSFIYLYSAPAFNIQREYKQADGTTFTAQPKGDEYLNYIQTSNGDILKYNEKTKNFEYATIKGDNLVPSGKIYTPPNSHLNRSAFYINIDKPTQSQLNSLREKRMKRFK
jgi:hypothetical protein